MSRRVVITGIGIVSPLGCGTELVWSRLLNSESGIRLLNSDLQNQFQLPVSVIATVPRRSRSLDDTTLLGHINGEYDEEKLFGRNVSKEMSPFIQYAILASDLALKHANLSLSLQSKSKDNNSLLGSSNYDMDNFGVAIASGGIGSLQDIVEASKCLDKGYKKLSPYFVPKILTNMAAGHVSIRHNLRGPIHSVATACAAGLHSIGDAFNFIRFGYADAMLAGGTESSTDPLSIAGFARMKALSTCTKPEEASRPFDKSRDGFVIGEGSCVLVLENFESALKRDAPIIAEIVGYGLSGDAFHPTSPSSDGRGAKNCMRMALKNSAVDPSEIGYLNAHATSTPMGDAIESSAIDSIFAKNQNISNKLFVSSTKGATGHLLGAAGALETAFVALAIRDGKIPPTLNLHQTDKEPTNFSHVPLKSLSYKSETGNELKYAMKNSFGFGGINASIVLGKVKLDK